MAINNINNAGFCTIDIKTSFQPNWAETGTAYRNSTIIGHDFTFLFQQGTDRRVPAHSEFLKLRLHNFTEKSGDLEITLPHDIHRRAFGFFQQYLYTDKFENTEDYSDEDIGQILKLAKMYCDQEECRYICAQLVPRIRLCFMNIFFFENVANKLNVPEVTAVVANFINLIYENTFEFVKTLHFLNLSRESMIEFLKLDGLNIKEFDLFNALLKWDEHKQTTVVGTLITLDVIDQIRFPIMSFTEFASINFELRKKLTGVEKQVLIFQYFATPFDEKTKFAEKCEWKPAYTSQRRTGEAHSNNKKGQQQFNDGNKDEGTGYYCHNQAKDDEDQTHQKFTVDTWTELVEKFKTFKNCSGITADIRNFHPDQTLVSPTSEKVPAKNLNNVMLNITIPLPQLCSEQNEMEMMKIHLRPIILKLRSNFNLERFLFMKNNQSKHSNPLWNLLVSKMNIEIVINGIVFLKINTKEKEMRELQIGFGGEQCCTSDKLSTLLSEFLPSFQKLALYDSELPTNLSSSVKFETVTQLVLWGVRDVENEELGKLGSFLQHFTNLSNLICWTKKGIRRSGTKKVKQEGKLVPEKSTINLSTDLLSSRSNLRKMSLKCEKIVLTTYAPTELKFELLTEFYTNSCHFSPIIYECFDKLFPTLKRATFGYCNYQYSHIDVNTKKDNNISGSPSSTLSEEILLPSVSIKLVNTLVFKMKNMEYIRVQSLDWNIPPFGTEEEEKLYKFLRKTGLKPPGKKYPYNFLLEKDNETTNGWKGTLYDGREEELRS